MITIYTDGAFSNSRNKMGIGIVFLDSKNNKILEYSNMYTGGSNNKAELAAVIIALRIIKKPITAISIFTDSEYVRGCAILGWERKKNVKLWEEFDKQFTRVSELCSNITISHVDGHSSNYWNNYVDDLAVKASHLL